MAKIAIVGNSDGNGRFGVNGNYMEWVSQFGNPVIFYGDTNLFEEMKFDALVLPGGADVTPSRYSKLPSIYSGRADPHLEYFDMIVLPELIGKLPIFGICRGLQTLNVVMGGTLKQHLWGHPYSSHDEDLIHDVVISGSKKEFKINSFHHQGISVVGKGIDIVLRAKEDGVIEGINSLSNYFAGVQYHPERAYDIFSKQLFQNLLERWNSK